MNDTKSDDCYPALITPHIHWMWADLEGYVAILVQTLRQLGVTKRGVLAINCNRPLLMIGLSRAAPQLGYALQPLNPQLPLQQTLELLANSGAEWLLTEASYIAPLCQCAAGGRGCVPHVSGTTSHQQNDFHQHIGGGCGCTPHLHILDIPYQIPTMATSPSCQQGIPLPQPFIAEESGHWQLRLVDVNYLPGGDNSNTHTNGKSSPVDATIGGLEMSPTSKAPLQAPITRKPPIPLQPEEVQLIITTSGSSGQAKGVMLSGNNISAAVQAANSCITLSRQDSWLLCLPLHHIGGMAIIYRCASAKATVVIPTSSRALDVANALVQHSCTHLSLVPTMLAQLQDVLPIPPLSLRYVLVGGAALDPKLARHLLAAGWPLCISYGMSETASQIATLCKPPLDWSGNMVGLPLPTMQLRIDQSSGCISVRGPAVMLGYTNPQRRLGEGLTADGWLATADIGHLDATGQLSVLGRADQMLISGGIKIHPQQVESILVNCPFIDEVAVTGRADPRWGQLITAIFAGASTVSQMEAWCRANMSSYMRPRVFIKVATLPRTTLGKVDRVMLSSLVGGWGVSPTSPVTANHAT